MLKNLTNEIAQKAWKLIEEVEELGGMTKAIEAGIPKMRIEEAAARKQAELILVKILLLVLINIDLEKEDAIQTLRS